MPPVPSEDFLTRKAGPLPVWAWAALGLGAAYAYSRYKAGKSAQTQSTAATQSGAAAAQPAGGGPEYIIENNLPWQTPASSPVNVSVTAPPVILPPGVSTQPPLNGPTLTPVTPPDIPGGTAIAPVTPSTPRPTPTPAGPTTHKVVAGDNLTKIAQEYGFGNNWQTLWQYNTGPSSPRSAADKATLLRQGPNLIYPGQTIYIPPK